MICHSCGKYWWLIGMHPTHRIKTDTVFICPVCWKNLSEPPIRIQEISKDEFRAMYPETTAPKTAPKNNLQEGKPRLSLLPMDILTKYLVPAYEEGVIKYERESWRQGFHTSVMVDAALRHIHEFFWHGHNQDKDSLTGKHHLAGAIFSLVSILHTLDTKPDLDDRQINQGLEVQPFTNHQCNLEDFTDG